MSHTHGHCLYHLVFSTRDRKSTIGASWKERLWAYMGGIARQNGMESLLIGGTRNHAHVLLLAPPTIAPAKAVQLIKGGSSKWVHETVSEGNSFSWQSGYGVFSVGFSQIEATKRYIMNQENHHSVVTFEEEYRQFLERHGIQYDKRFYLG